MAAKDSSASCPSSSPSARATEVGEAPGVGAFGPVVPRAARKGTAVEPASAADIPALVLLMEAFYLESAQALDRPWATKGFSTLLADPALGGAWLLRRDGQAAGYTVLTVGFSMAYGGMTGCIDDLFVCPEHRRHGLGTAALNAALAECRRRGLLALQVEVGRDNRSAIRLYQPCGLRLRADGRLVLRVDLSAAATDA